MPLANMQQRSLVEKLLQLYYSTGRRSLVLLNQLMPLPHDLCARLQNAFRARHQKIAVTHNTQNLGILSILLRAGFISAITRGTIEAPSPEAFHKVGDAQRRIWADLKYRDDRPVLHNMELISKPSKRVYMELQEIR
ncbi:hypothetical protein BD779DRAFT_1107579 [Infundibulicybe gibba]|nr:hypothetical protein BD779DRAFT_1107579 [Infundibulicybe gibba]